MIDAAVKFVPAWQRGLIARPGRLVLVRSVMSARPVHHLIVADAPCWLLEELEKSMRDFFWAGKDIANGGQCLVAWDRVCVPQEYGGLGIKNLRMQGLALRVRWQWLLRTDSSRPWRGLGMLKDQEAREVFDSLVKIRVGDGRKVKFWTDRWINGRSVLEIAPGIGRTVSGRSKNSRTVAQGLAENRWLLDIPGTLAFRGAMEFLELWIAISEVELVPEEPDRFSWPWSRPGEYTARSTYAMLMQGRERSTLAAAIWKNGAAPKCKIFTWLVAQHKIWTSYRRVRHGLQANSAPCFVCLQEEDNAEHILVQCVFAREVWLSCSLKLEARFQAPRRTSTLLSWWMAERERVRDKERRWFDALVCMGCHAIWKNRNA